MPADRPALFLMNQKLLNYARAVAAAANQDTLGADHAMLFCREAVPLLLAELEVNDLLKERFDALLSAQIDEPSDQTEPAAPQRRPSRKAKKSRRKKARHA